MENLYTNYSVVDTLYKGSMKTVEIAKMNLVNENFPNFFILKHFSNPEPPLEFLIHEKLSNHDQNIIKLYSSWKTSKKFFMCVEYCEYLDLGNYFSKMPRGPDYFSKVLQNCIQLALNLNTMHNLRITHNNLSYKKVLVTEKHVFKLSGFSLASQHSYANIDTSGRSRNSLSTSRSQTSSLDFSPYARDIKKLGIIFIELAVFKDCPELENKEPDELRDYLDSILKSYNFDKRFLELVINMISNEQESKVNTQKIVEKLIIMYKECSSNKAYFSSIKEKFGVDPGDTTLNIPSERINEESIILNSSEKSLKSNSSSSNVDFTQISDNEPSEESKELIEKTLSIVISKEELPDKIEKNDHENPSSEISSLVISLSQTIQKEDKLSNPQLISDANNLSMSIISNNLDTSQVLPSSIVLQKVCSICENICTDRLVELPCNHFYHKTCIRDRLEQKLLENSRNKINPFKCYIENCEEFIGFEYLYHQDILSLEAKKISLMQLYANHNFFCRDCNKLIKGVFMLSDKLERLNIFCKGCKRNHCNFCGVLGGHRFYCDLFRDFTRGRSNFESYVQYIENFDEKKIKKK